MNIYLDVCCYSRPFDDQIQDKIRLETEAILSILNKAVNSEYSINKSSATDYEISKINNENKKILVQTLYNSVLSKPLVYEDSINRRALLLAKYNIKYLDALHISYCEYHVIDYMLTTDKILINAAKRSNSKLRVINPVHFIMEVLQ